MKQKVYLASVSAIALALGMAASGTANAGAVGPQGKHFLLPGAKATVNKPQFRNGQIPTSNEEATSTVYDNEAYDDGSTRDNDVDSSYGEAAGITHVQQNNGSTNELGIASAVQHNIEGNGLVGTFAGVWATTYDNYTEHHDGTRTNDILDSFNNYSGVAAVQQNNGDNNSMGIANAVHGNTGGWAFVFQGALVSGTTYDQSGDGIFGALYDDDSTRINTIDPSFQNSHGINSVQQNNGNANAMGIANSVVANTGSGVVLQYAGTFGSVYDQLTIDSGLDRDNVITDGSFDGSSGINNVQQNNGDANVLGISNAVAANVGPGLGDPLNNDVGQLVTVYGEVAFTAAYDNDFNFEDGQRENIIHDSFNESEALTNVQQNNGSNNVLGIANAVQANLGTGPVRRLNGTDSAGQFSLVVGGKAFSAASQFGTPLTPPPSHRENSITDSFEDASGIANIQQNNGDNNVMGIGNAVIANVDSGDKTDVVYSSTAATSGESFLNIADEDILGSGANRDNLINPSFNGFEGMATVQQNNGNNNVIGSSSAVVANINNESDGAAQGVSNAATGSAGVYYNVAIDHPNTDRVNTIEGSFEDAAGIMTVQQNNGDNNVIGASTAVTADIDNDPGEGFGPAASLAALSSTVTGNTTVVSSTSELPGYQNVVTNSFNGAAGVMTVQQNNGSNNSIQSAVAATVNVN